MIKKIPKWYVSDECVQVRIPFNRNITLINSDFENDGVLCHYDFDSDSQNINKYLTDERRELFPYGNIPLYKEVRWELFESLEYINYTNQILEFDKHYISITSNYVRDRYVVKDGEEAIIYSKILSIPKRTRDNELKKKEIFDMYKDRVLACVTNGGHYIDFKKDFNSFFNNKGGILILNDDGKIKFRMVELIVRGYYLFMREYDIPFNKYTLEELKAFNDKMNMISEPKIYLKFNPNINSEDIRMAKKLVRKLK